MNQLRRKSNLYLKPFLSRFIENNHLLILEIVSFSLEKNIPRL